MDILGGSGMTGHKQYMVPKQRKNERIRALWERRGRSEETMQRLSKLKLVKGEHPPRGSMGARYLRLLGYLGFKPVRGFLTNAEKSEWLVGETRRLNERR